MTLLIPSTDLREAKIDNQWLTCLVDKLDTTGPFERSFVAAKLKMAKGNVIRAAESMDVTRQMVYKLIERHGIDLERSGPAG